MPKMFFTENGSLKSFSTYGVTSKTVEIEDICYFLKCDPYVELTVPQPPEPNADLQGNEQILLNYGFVKAQILTGFKVLNFLNYLIKGERERE